VNAGAPTRNWMLSPTLPVNVHMSWPPTKMVPGWPRPFVKTPPLSPGDTTKGSGAWARLIA